MRIMVLHDRYNNDPVIVRPDAINMIRKGKEEGKEYSTILGEGFLLDVEETIGTVMTKIKKAESGEVE